MKCKECSQTGNKRPSFFFPGLFDRVGVVFAGGKAGGPQVKETVTSVRKSCEASERQKSNICFSDKSVQKKMRVTGKPKPALWGTLHCNQGKGRAVGSCAPSTLPVPAPGRLLPFLMPFTVATCPSLFPHLLRLPLPLFSATLI